MPNEQFDDDDKKKQSKDPSDIDRFFFQSGYSDYASLGDNMQKSSQPEKFCWNCGEPIANPHQKWCDNCRAPLEESTKNKVMARTEPLEKVKCWRCGATTSGNICGICGSPLTKKGLESIKTTRDQAADTSQQQQTISVISPKDRQQKQVFVSYDEILDTISKYVTIKDSELVPNIGPQIMIQQPANLKETLGKLREDPLFTNNNLKVLIREMQITPAQKEIIIRFYYWEKESTKEQFKLKNIWLNIVLFIATIGTVSWAGYFYINAIKQEFSAFQTNVPLDIFLFAISLMGILTIHEFGHYTVTRLKNIDATLPYFIPVPPFGGLTLGTFGALIRQKEQIETRDDLFEIGLAGPLAGFLVAIPVYLGGIALTYVVQKPADYTPPDISNYPVIILDDYILRPIAASIGLFPSYDPSTQLLYQHPMMFAGWVGFLLTGINLIPASQLDGGHASRALLGQRAQKIVSIVMGALLLINNMTWIFGLLVLFMTFTQQHPGPTDDVSPVHWSKYPLSVLAIAVCVLTVPLPINQIQTLLGG
ncbi:MAG: site-2 protease family protein [Asgard group archaeon]|nr:site-2 protease family protein [Asgard group archaeon]